MKIAEFNDYNKEYGQPELQKLLIKPYEFDIEKLSNDKLIKLKR